MSVAKKFAVFGSLLAVVALAAYLGVAFFYPYAEGWEAGTLNYFTRQGFVFKTYEGRMIQEGIKGKVSSGSFSSNEFKFSVEDPALADSINHRTGDKIEVHYKEYLHALWWRGDSKYVVDSIR
ncbi:MAG: hypothetical protein J6Y77_03440 [Paludibacteraceae bacterium]|nr:hypothetical protein [Paludibacteraceae bacterium]